MSFSDIVNAVLLNADYLLLLLLRTGGLILGSPIFGRNNIPAMTRIGLVASISLLFFFDAPAVVELSYTNVFGYLIVCAGELMVGVCLAFVTNMFFSLAFTGGQLIDMQIGFGIVNVLDPQLNTQIPMTGNLLNITLLLLFFIMNGHQRLIEILWLTLEMLPVGGLSLSTQTALAAVEIFARTFALGVMVALPVVCSGLVIEICFGVLMRTVPQLNVFVIGIPLKILIGFFILIAILPIFINFSEKIFAEMFSAIEIIFGTLVTP